MGLLQGLSKTPYMKVLTVSGTYVVLTVIYGPTRAALFPRGALSISHISYVLDL